MTLRESTFLPALAMLATGCAVRTVESTPPDPRCPAPGEAPADWIEWDEGAYRLSLPRSFELRHRGGIDSEVASWSDGRVEIHADYGLFSNSFDPGMTWGGSILVPCQELGPGRPRIASFRWDDGYALGAFWDDLPDPRYPDGARLSLVGRGPSAADRAVLRLAIASVRFPDPGVRGRR